MSNEIINIWEENLELVMKEIRKKIRLYPYISMDTEFPGVVAKPTGSFSSMSSFTYQKLRCNIDLLKIIQLGITISDSEGNIYFRTFQFNFHFDIEKDMYSQESIDLLVKAEIDFNKHKNEGIKINKFSEILITSGLVMNTDVIYISFHSAYDFGYLIKMILNNPFPENENLFLEFLEALFPIFYDIKFILRSSNYSKMGLQEIADCLNVKRLGKQHQAGSDSYLTCLTFWEIKKKNFIGIIDENENMNKLFGIEKAIEEFI